MPGYFDIVWPICTFLYLLIIVDTLLSKTTFSVQANRLTVIKSSLFYKKAKIYDIDQMQDMEIEEVLNKRYLFFFKDPTSRYAITFFYNEKEEKLDGQLAKVHAEQLLEAILAVRDEH
jgi:hypothetical protein